MVTLLKASRWHSLPDNTVGKELLRDFAIALSLANLCLLRNWRLLLEDSFFLPNYSAVQYRAALLNLALLAGVLFALRTVSRRMGMRAFHVSHWVAMGILVIPLNYLRTLFPSYLALNRLVPRIGETGVVLLAGTTFIILLYAVFRWHLKLLIASEIAVLIFGPLVIVTLVRASLRSLPIADSTLPARAAAPMQPVSTGQPRRMRVVFLLFDELDESLTFRERPALLSLPELDRLRSESLYAQNAFAPGAYTLWSLAAMLTGRPLSKCFMRGNELMVQVQERGSETVRWNSLPNLFTRAHQAGVRTGVVGWYFPYCRVVGESLASCSWQPLLGFANDAAPGLLASAGHQIAGLMPWGARYEHFIKYQSLLGAAKGACADPQLDFVWVHWPIPHYPPIYNRQTKSFTSFHFRDFREWYVHNLVLVDRTFGEVRAAMERAGTWERTAIVVTSDHPWISADQYGRKKDPRVPFLVRLPTQANSIPYSRALNTVVVHDLVLALLAGEVSGADQLVDWLGLNGSGQMGMPQLSK